MNEPNDTEGTPNKYPQWMVLLVFGLLAFMGQYVFVLLTSKTASTELATHELRQIVAVQRADFESHRKQIEQQFTMFNTQIQVLYNDITKRLDRMEQKQEEIQRMLLLKQNGTAPR